MVKRPTMGGALVVDRRPAEVEFCHRPPNTREEVMFKRTPKFETLVQELKDAKLAYERAARDQDSARETHRLANDVYSKANMATYRAREKVEAAEKALVKALGEE